MPPCSIWYPSLNLGFFIWLVAAGFYSVHLYQRRTGSTISVREGARMGWITGIVSFAISTVFFTLTMVRLSMSAGGLGELYRKQMESMSMPDQSMREALDLLQSPAGVTFVVLGSLLFIFVMITMLCTAGGALGAKILDKS